MIFTAYKCIKGRQAVLRFVRTTSVAASILQGSSCLAFPSPRLPPLLRDREPKGARRGGGSKEQGMGVACWRAFHAHDVGASTVLLQARPQGKDFDKVEKNLLGSPWVLLENDVIAQALIGVFVSWYNSHTDGSTEYSGTFSYRGQKYAKTVLGIISRPSQQSKSLFVLELKPIICTFLSPRASNSISPFGYHQVRADKFEYITC